MSAKTKIIVLKSKELIYAGIFAVLGILLVLLLWFMFSSDSSEDTSSEDVTETLATYVPGVYSSTLNLGGTALQLQTTVNEHAVTHVDIINLSDTVTAMYPLLAPSVDAINEQLAVTGNPEDVTYASDSQYTTTVLLEAIKQAASLARVTDSAP